MNRKPTPALDYLSGLNPFGLRPGLRNERHASPSHCCGCPFLEEPESVDASPFERRSFACGLLEPESVRQRQQLLTPDFIFDEQLTILCDSGARLPCVDPSRPVCCTQDWQELAQAEMSRLIEEGARMEMLREACAAGQFAGGMAEEALCPVSTEPIHVS